MQVDVLIRVRFAECDAQNIVFNARYADYLDIASTEYMRYLCGGYQALVKQGLVTQVVSLKIDWQSSARFDDVLKLSMSCARVGSTSFTLECQIDNFTTGELLAKGTVVYVLLNEQSMSKTAVPAELREQLESVIVRGPIDFAGVSHP